MTPRRLVRPMTSSTAFASESTNRLAPQASVAIPMIPSAAGLPRPWLRIASTSSRSGGATVPMVETTEARWAGSPIAMPATAMVSRTAGTIANSAAYASPSARSAPPDAE
jgi:hypothetical protein